ncbi:Cytochrome P450 71D8 [Morella rubra]|uniref:Cytochrome P450 71D8 n=1 Tax=Morella rubra TaxID=262757 RepID=A0A6A1WDB0_9ROSI|nr:Cytochrome P450 71D8 [Morella rubra]
MSIPPYSMALQYSLAVTTFLLGNMAPLMHLQLGEVSAVVASSPRMAKEFMHTHGLAFAQRPELFAFKIMTYGGSDIAFSPYCDYWRQMRKVCTLELLRAKRVQSFSSLREDEVHNLIESIRVSSGSPNNFTEKVFSLTSTIVPKAAFGSKRKDHDAFISLAREPISVTGGFELADLFPSQKYLLLISGMKAKVEKMHKKVDRILENIIHEHRDSHIRAANSKVEPGQEDLVDILLGLQQICSLEFTLTTNNIKAVLWARLKMTYGGSDIAFSPYCDYWRQMRKICTLELLSAKRVQSFSSLREDEPLAANKDHDAFISLVSLTGGFDLADLFPSQKILPLISGMKARVEKMHRRVDRILENIIHEHRDSHIRAANSKLEPGQEDLVDVLLGLQQSCSLEFTLTTNNIKAVIWDIFAGGSDTSSTTVQWAMSEMMRNPRVLKKAQDEIRKALRGKEKVHEQDIQDLSYLKLVIQETLRLHPPAPMLLPRECRVVSEIDEYVIPVKTKVIINAWAILRDPAHWQDAESFIPERFSGSSINFKGSYFEYTPFGSGRRICPGMSFGLANIELPLAQLLYQFDWELPAGMKPEDLDMSETSGAVAARKNNLYLIATSYPPLDN